MNRWLFLPIWINVINFVCKKGVGRQHTTFTLYQNAAFSKWVFSALEGLVLNEKMWFLPLISYWHAYWFSAVIVSGWHDLPSYARTFMRLKKLISEAPEDAMLKIRRPVYKLLFKSNRVLHDDQNSDVNQTCQQSVFSPMRACIRIWCTAGAVERRSQMFVYRLSPFPFSLLAIFSPFPQTESLFTG